MPIPESLILYGSQTIVTAVSPFPHISGTPNRVETRTVTLHYTHGWCYSGGGGTAGVHYWLDLDGTLYQNNERDRRYLHAGGGPHFSSTTTSTNKIRNSSPAIEICRFGKIEPRPGGTPGYRINGYTNMNYSIDNTDPEWCDYSTHPSANGTGPLRFNLWKIPGGQTLQNDARNYYKVKMAPFDDTRNPERPQFVNDILFTEEQYATLVLWLKALLEHYRIPKLFLRDPDSGAENPWIDTDVLARASSTSTQLRNEAIERVIVHQGIWGHMNVQGNRVDPGASMDYYRLKRALSDHWWYPINLNRTTRALNYLDTARSTDYLALTEYRDIDQLEEYYQKAEEGETGFFPIGVNRVWHGGIHLTTPDGSLPLYAMANGWIVAARVTNGSVNGQALAFSRCFVLIKHMVHTQNNTAPDHTDEIDYQANSTRVIYSLYMHMEPYALTKQAPDTTGVQHWDFNYDTMPKWLCHFLIDNPTHATVNTGGIIYPNAKVDLSDWIGSTGDYITDISTNPPLVGKTVHLEVFTTEDPNTFGGTHWSSNDVRIIDPTPDIADYASLNDLVRDTGGDGIDTVDVKNAAPGLRQYALQSRSEWSLTTRNELGHRKDSMTDAEFNQNIRPFCFHTDIIADTAVPAAEIGPYHGNSTVWHIHPLTFLHWMNTRVDRHEQILASQDKPLTPNTSNITVEENYVVGFQNPTALPQAAAGVNYGEAQYNENTFEITVNQLTDMAQLATSPQTSTRFNFKLLQAIDMCNDYQTGLQIVEGYVSTGAVLCSDTTKQASHRQGDAADLRPSNTNISDWYELYSSAQQAKTYIKNAYDQDLEFLITADTVPAGTTNPTQTDLNNNAAELNRRLVAAEAANDPNHPGLTAEPQVQYLDRMRLHLGFPSTTTVTTTMRNTRWLDVSGNVTSGPAQVGDRLRIEVQVEGFNSSVPVHFFILSQVFSKSGPPDIRDITTLETFYGARNFNLDEIERHDQKQGTVDSYVQRIQKDTGISDTNGQIRVICDWEVPALMPIRSGSIYPVAIIGAGSQSLQGGTTSEHTVAVGPVIQLPHISRVAWANDSAGQNIVQTISRRTFSVGYVVIDTIGLPSDCELTVTVRDLRQNQVVLNETRTPSQGNSTTIIAVQAPRRNRQYHASVRVFKASPQVDFMNGATVEWVR